MHRFLRACVLLLSLKIICGKYDRTNDLFDFYAGDPQGLPVFSFLNAVLSPTTFPNSFHIIYVGDCTDMSPEEWVKSWPMVFVSYQCLVNDEDIDTCRYSLQADDRDLDFVRDTSCTNAIIQSQNFQVSPAFRLLDQSAVNILLIPLHCGCHDTIHLSRIALQLLSNIQQRLGSLPALIFTFNCDITNSVSLLASSIEAKLRSPGAHVHHFGRASLIMQSGHCDWNVRNVNSLESNPHEHDHAGNFSEHRMRGYQNPNVLATVFDPQTLSHLSPSCLSALQPKVSLVPPNGSVIYCDVPFHLQFMWLYNSELQPQAKSDHFDAGILHFSSPYLANEPDFRLQLSQDFTTVLLSCSNILPDAPLLVHLEANFELFSTDDDVDGDTYTFVYTLATPCSMPTDQIPGHLTAALRDASIFTWNESNGSSHPPDLQCKTGTVCYSRFRAPAQLPCRLSCNNHSFYAVAEGPSRVLGRVVSLGSCEYEIQVTFHVAGVHTLTLVPLSAGGSAIEDAEVLGHFLPIHLLGPVTNISVHVADSDFVFKEGYCSGLSCVNGRGVWIRNSVCPGSDPGSDPDGSCGVVGHLTDSSSQHFVPSQPQMLCRSEDFFFAGLEGNSIRDLIPEKARSCFNNITLLLLGHSHERMLLYDMLSFAFPDLWHQRAGFVNNFHHLLLHDPLSIAFKGISYNFSFFCGNATGAARCVPPPVFLEQSRRSLSLLLKHAREAEPGRRCVLIAGSVAHISMIMTMQQAFNASLAFLQLLQQTQIASGCTVMFATSPAPRSFDILADGFSNPSSYNRKIATRNNSPHGSIRIDYDRVVALNNFCIEAARQLGIGVVDLHAFSSSNVLKFYDHVHPICPPGFHSRVFTNQHIGGVTAQTAMMGVLRGLLNCPEAE